jgi:three-Cys-motif partner protein
MLPAVDVHDDGLPIADVGQWAKDKHALLTEYIKISSGARAKFLGPSEATYIDPFAGPGRARVRETGEVIDGSAVAAWKASTVAAPFTRVVVADIDANCVNATYRRLRAAGCDHVVSMQGPAVETVPNLRAQLDPYGLHFALLDPFNLEDLAFSVLEDLSQLRRVDLMVHLSTGDMQRNFASYSQEENAILDRFAPGWRKVVDLKSPPFDQRQAIVKYWFSSLKRLKLPAAPEMHRVRNSKGSTMYWLVFMSRAEVARKFWGYAQSYLSQPGLF